MTKLTALSVKNAKPGRHADGNGLYLFVKPKPGKPDEGGAKSWLLRIQVDGKRRDVGLGSVSDVVKKLPLDATETIQIPLLHRKILTLGEARDKAALLRSAAKAGLDPVAERDKERRTIPTFRVAAQEAYNVLKDGFGGRGGDVFIKSLENHTFKVLGDQRVDKITAADITAALTPIWVTKPDMARKVRQRISKVLNFAHNKGWRPTEAPSKSVSAGLVRQPKGGKYRAMPYTDVPAFVGKLFADMPTIGRRALIFQIFTAARPGEVRGARWGQIDFDKRDWNRPAELMKGFGAPAHTVTLSTAAIAFLEHLKGDREPEDDDLIFPGKSGVIMSDMTMNKVLRAAKLPYDSHGFRSSFRDWTAEKMPAIGDSVAEAALSHTVSDKVVAAYKRTTFLEQRRELLEKWGQYISSSC